MLNISDFLTHIHYKVCVKLVGPANRPPLKGRRGRREGEGGREEEKGEGGRGEEGEGEGGREGEKERGRERGREGRLTPVLCYALAFSQS